MTHSFSSELKLPKDWQQFRLPSALERRLQQLLDRQDRDGKLSPQERREATALTELIDILSLPKASAFVASKRNGA